MFNILSLAKVEVEKKSKLSKGAFTLIEVMVVLLVVAILAAVAIPILQGRIDTAMYDSAKALYDTGKYQEAEDRFNEYLDLRNPLNAPGALFYRTVCIINLKGFVLGSKECIKFLEEALKKESQQSEAIRITHTYRHRMGALIHLQIYADRGVLAAGEAIENAREKYPELFRKFGELDLTALRRELNLEI